jgi:succinate dehydrogenase/fumarate reductase flavoprotein subunit
VSPEPAGPADVVIAGYGPAGAAAAIAAHDAGASVLVVESAAGGGGNARYSGGFLFDIPGPAAVEHLAALCFGRTPRPVLEAYAAGLHGLDGWLRSLGGATDRFDPAPARLPAPFPSWPHLPGGRDISYRVVAGGTGRRGQALWDLLHAAVRERGIEVRYQTAAERLVRDPDGTVSGLVVRPAGAPGPCDAGAPGLRDAGASGLRDAGAPLILPAAGGVVLACGGFEADPSLAAAYLPVGPSWPVGHPGNDGTGLRLAQQAGAALWHMYGCFGWFAFRTPEFPAPFAVDFFAASHLFVDADGRRFGDETGYEVHDRLRALLSYLPRNPNRPRLPSWAVFDEAARLAGPLNGLLGTPNDYTWSADNAAEVARGWIKTAASPAGLAAQIGVDPAVLTGTLDEYNAAARAGRDDRFGRSADTLVPLDTGRLYAIETWPGIAGTTGGPQHNERAQVLRPDGRPVPGLYAAGAVSLVWGHLIEHGGGLTDALVFGRIAGVEAAHRAAAAALAPSATTTPAATTPAATAPSAATERSRG